MALLFGIVHYFMTVLVVLLEHIMLNLRQTEYLLRDLHQYAISHIEVTSHKIWPTSNEMSKKKKKNSWSSLISPLFLS